MIDEQMCDKNKKADFFESDLVVIIIYKIINRYKKWLPFKVFLCTR